MKATCARGGSRLRARAVVVLVALLVLTVVTAARAQSTDTIGPDTGSTATTTPAATASVTVTLSGDGRVVSSPEGISCPGACSAEFPEDTLVVLNAMPAGGDFESWGGACEGTETQCGFNASGAVTVEATFESVDTNPGPPPPPPPGGGPPPPPILNQIDQILEQLPTANVAFNAPDELQLGETAVIQLLVSGERPIRELKEEITALGEREGARIRVSDQVEARLTGLGFRIEAITPERQAVAGAGVTEWRWEIEPTESGPGRLHLTLTAVIDVRGSPSTHTIRTFERVLNVQVTWSDRVTGFLGGNWQWLWTAILLPIAAWLLRRRKARPAA